MSSDRVSVDIRVGLRRLLWRVISAKVRLLLGFYYRVNFRGEIYPSKLRRDKFTLHSLGMELINATLKGEFHTCNV